MDRDRGSGGDVHVADGIEAGYAGAEDGCVLRGVDVGWDADGGFGAEDAVFGVYENFQYFLGKGVWVLLGREGVCTSTTLCYTVDRPVVTHLEETLLARFAGAYFGQLFSVVDWAWV